MKRKRIYEQPTAHVVVLQVTNQLLAGSTGSGQMTPTDYTWHNESEE